MKIHQKGFAIPLVIAIVGILAIAGGVYLVSKNKPGDTANQIKAPTADQVAVISDTDLTSDLMRQMYGSDKVLSNPEKYSFPKGTIIWKPTASELKEMCPPTGVCEVNLSDSVPELSKGENVAWPELLYKQSAPDGLNVYLLTGNGKYFGASLFKQQNGDSLLPVSVSKFMAESYGVGVDGVSKPSRFEIGKNQIAFSYQWSGCGQGQCSSLSRFYAYTGGSFKDVFDAGISESSDGSDCYSQGTESGGDTVGNGNPWSYDAKITTKTGANPDFYDLVLNWSGTKAVKVGNTCHVSSAQPKTEVYHWIGTKYELVK